MPGNVYAIRGRVTRIRGTSERTVIQCVEPNEDWKRQYTFSVVWFGQSYMAKRICENRTYVFCGKTGEYMGEIQMVSPMSFSENEAEVCKILPVYSKIAGMSNEYLVKQIGEAINYIDFKSAPPAKEDLAKTLSLMPLKTAFAQLHQPEDGAKYKQASTRIAFEEIYDFYSELQTKESYKKPATGNDLKQETLMRKLIQDLPYKLTNDQISALEALVQEARQGKRMNALISGDVGCGKTIIAILLSVFMYENGYQTIMMAPTLVLSQQHANEFSKLLSPLGINVGLLTTEITAKARKKLLDEFSAGNISILIGTNAVLSADVKPYKLGLTIVDEEHKFGVGNKELLENYDKSGIHHVSMTATPIPRSMALTIYGNGLSVLPIQTMPQGRLPVETRHYTNTKSVFDEIYAEVQKGHQAYIVCPFIDASEIDRFKSVISVDMAESAAKKYYSKLPGQVRVASLSGDMAQKDVLATINRFAAHEIDVLVSTTIVEVGVNVPNATIIAIMSAERFGLSALHQLRGRVGRSSIQSYCILCSPVQDERFDIMCRTNNGFEIAEHDFRMRGPGDLNGTAQSGHSKPIEYILKFPKLADIIKRKLDD